MKTRINARRRLQHAVLRAGQLGGRLRPRLWIVTLPVLLLTMFAQKQIVAGLTAGAVKGG